MYFFERGRHTVYLIIWSNERCIFAIHVIVEPALKFI